MPLDGSGVASKPAGTTATPNTTIESTKFNSVIDDIYAIFNLPRPVSKGGTGVTDLSLPDGTFRIENTSDDTKKVALDLSGLTTASTRTITLPDKSGTMAMISDLPTKGHIYGLTMSNNVADATNDLDVAAGECASTETSPVLMVYSGQTGRRLDAAYGASNGARFDAAISDGTWHAFVISNGTTVAFGMSKSIDPTGTPNYPSGYTHYRRIGSIVRASLAIKAFIQDGDDFTWSIPVDDINAVNPGTSAVTRTMTLPLGIRVKGRFAVLAYTNGTAARPGSIYISDLSVADTAPTSIGTFSVWGSNAAAVASGVGAVVEIYTNTSGQVRSRLENSSADSSLRMGTLGWTDRRGSV